MKVRTLTWSLALLVLLAAPAVANDVILNGADLWRTAGGGSTFSTFTADPIPAGFFCPGSKAFDGKVDLEGAPLVTEPPGILPGIDTVVRRLDDATFDVNGVATTRLQLMALSLVSVEPIDVGCERPFDVAVSLSGEQEITEMKIYRASQKDGSYAAPLAIDTKVVFTPVGGEKSEALQLQRSIRLGPGTNSYWTTTDRIGTVDEKPVLVDTDGDGVADSAMPPPSNFSTGVLPAGTGGGVEPELAGCPNGYCAYQSCHCDPTSTNPYEPNGSCSHLHCVWTCVFCQPQAM